MNLTSTSPAHSYVSHGVVQHELPADAAIAATYPQLTSRGVPTDAYDETSPSGLVDAREAEASVLATAGRRGSHTTLVGTGSHPSDMEKGGKEADVKLVTWLENDPENPYNWGNGKKWVQTILPTGLCFLSGLGSSIITGGLPEMAAHYSVSELVMNFVICVFVIGFGVGPLVLSPLSEMYGRKWLYIIPTWLYCLFTLPGCLTDSFAVTIVFRFLAGCAASACMCNAAGSIGDLWAINERGNKMAAFSMILFAAPCLGPLIGGYLTICTSAGFRSMWWLLFALCGFFALVSTFFLAETYHPALLQQRAKKLRAEGEADVMTEQERAARPLSEIARETLLRPMVMLTTEPIMMLFAGYLALIYSLLYSLFFAYPIVFQYHGFNAGEIGLCFLSVLVGIMLISLIGVPIQERYYQRQVVKHAPAVPPPEARLPLMMFCAVLLPIAEFIFAATSIHKVHWAGPLISGIPFGASLVGIYVSANTYLAVAFSRYSASAMAAKTLLRSLAGAAVPMYIQVEYGALGNWWAGAVWAFISLVMCPIPFVFFFYGAQIRAKSKMAS